MIYFQDRKEFEKLLTDTFSPFWMRVDWALLLFSHFPVCVYFENANAHLKISLFPSLFQFMLKLLQFPYRDSLKTVFFMCTSYHWNRLCRGEKQLPSSWSILISLWFDEVTSFTYHFLPAYWNGGEFCCLSRIDWAACINFIPCFLSMLLHFLFLTPCQRTACGLWIETAGQAQVLAGLVRWWICALA